MKKVASVAAITLFVFAGSASIFKFLPEPYLVALLDIGSSLLAWFAGIAALAAAVKDRLKPYRKIWLFVGIALILWALGDTTWAIMEVGLGLDPFPSIADLFWSIGTVPFFIGLVYGFRQLGAKPTRISLVVSAALSVVILTDYIFLLFLPILESRLSPVQKFLDLLYPVADGFLLIPIIFTLLTFRYEVPSRPLKLVAIGLSARIVYDFLFSLMTLKGTYFSGAPAGLLWLGAYLIIGLTCVNQISSASDKEPTSASADMRGAA